MVAVRSICRRWSGDPQGVDAPVVDSPGQVQQMACEIDRSVGPE
jgi:hypothetical protein